MNQSDLENNIATNDQIGIEKKTDTRRPKLTLRHLHKLRKIRELKALELANQSKQLAIIYAQPTEPVE